MINIKDLNFSYDNSSPALLSSINLHINSGSYVSILGENGSAKSTLIKLILGFLKPNSGSIDISTKKLGYVPQRMESFNSQFPITVQEVLLSHFKALKLKDKGLIKKCLEAVNMLQYRNSLIGNLSGGQMQKIFISRAILGTPDLIILDEPSTGIDIKSQEEIYKVIKDLNSAGVTIISVEHNLKAALDNSTHILRLHNGGSSLYTVSDYTNLLENIG
jgi:zinc transport system ATP-binding protein